MKERRIKRIVSMTVKIVHLSIFVHLSTYVWVTVELHPRNLKRLIDAYFRVGYIK